MSSSPLDSSSNSGKNRRKTEKRRGRSGDTSSSSTSGHESLRRSKRRRHSNDNSPASSETSRSTERPSTRKHSKKSKHHFKKQHRSPSSSSSSSSAVTRRRFRSKEGRNLSSKGTGTEEERSGREAQEKASDKKLKSKRSRRVSNSSSSSSVRSHLNTKRRRGPRRASPTGSSTSSSDSGRQAEKSVSSSRYNAPGRITKRKGKTDPSSAATQRQPNTSKRTAKEPAAGRERRKATLATTDSPASTSGLHANATETENKACTIRNESNCNDVKVDDQAGPSGLAASRDPGPSNMDAGLQAGGIGPRNRGLVGVRDPAIARLFQAAAMGFLNRGSTPRPWRAAASNVPPQDAAANPDSREEDDDHAPPTNPPPEEAPPVDEPHPQTPTNEVDIDKLLDIALGAMLVVLTVLILRIGTDDTESRQQQDNANGSS